MSDTAERASTSNIPLTELTEVALTALTSGMTTAAGDQLSVDVQRPSGSGTLELAYLTGDTVLFTRKLRIYEREKTISLDPVELTASEHEGFINANAVHERFIANLTGTECTVRATINNIGGLSWTPYFDWAHGANNMNAAALGSALTYLRLQARWDTRGISEAIVGIAGPDPALQGTEREGDGTPIYVIENTTPASLAEQLETIKPGLSQEVFGHMLPWYGERIIKA